MKKKLENKTKKRRTGNERRKTRHSSEMMNRNDSEENNEHEWEQINTVGRNKDEKPKSVPV